MTTIRNPHLAARIASLHITFLPDLLPAYLDHMHTRCLGAKHIEHVGQHLRDCQASMGLSLLEMTKPDLKRYGALLAVRHRDGLIAASTVRKYQASVRGFFAWAADEEHIPVDPARKAFLAPKLPKRLPKFLSPDDFARLMAAANYGPHPERDQALIATMAMCGLRVSEALGLDWDHLAGGYVTVIGKGNKERRVPVPASLTPHLERWREAHPLGGEGPVFTSNAAPYTRLGYEACWRKYFPELARRAGIKRKVTSHALRHTYATNLLRGGVPLDQIQKLLGHEDISTTGIYAKTHIGDETRAAIDAALGSPPPIGEDNQ